MNIIGYHGDLNSDHLIIPNGADFAKAGKNINNSKDIKVAIMGCIVNGPGEAKDADIGIAGGQNFFTIFKKGKRLDLHLSEDQAIEYLIKEIDKI